MRRFAFALVLAAAVLPGQAAPGQPARAESPRTALSVSTSEVMVPVTVTDDKGRFVSNLDQADFKIYDEGKLQQISYFTRERSQPVVVGFLLDLSNASRLHWKNYQESAAELALAL